MKNKIIFRKFPSIIYYFKGDAISNNEKDKLVQTIKKGGFKFGNMLATVWFGAFLFAMQSYFLRQNLKTMDSSIISN